MDIVTDFEEMFCFIRNNGIELSSEQISEIDKLINTQVFSHALQVVETNETNFKKKVVIKKLVDFQKKSVNNIWSYDDGRQILLMLLLKNNFLSVAVSLAKVSNFVRGRKKLRG